MVGGLVGRNDNSSISNSYWDIETSGTEVSDGGTGKTTSEMKTQETFVDWDFVNTWRILSTVNSGYPSFIEVMTLICNAPILTGPDPIICAKPTITFQCLTPILEDHPWELQFKVQVSSDEAGMDLISEIDSSVNPELFRISTDNATWQAFPTAGVPPAQYGCQVSAVVEVGPIEQCWIKLSVGAEDA